MPGGQSPGPSILNPQQYEALRGKGFSKESAAKISNAASSKKAPGRKKKGKTS